MSFYDTKKKMMTKKTFIFYNDWKDYTEEMTREEKWLFLECILDFQEWLNPDPEHLKFIWSKVKKQLDADNKKREEEVEKRSKAWIEWNKKRWWVASDRKPSQLIASATSGSQLIASATSGSQLIASATSGSQLIASATSGSQLIASATSGSQLIADNENETVNDNVTVNESKERLLTEGEEKSPVKEYGSPEVNEILEIIKWFNDWICDWTIKKQRQFWKSLISKLKKINKVKNKEYTRSQYISWLLEVVSKSQYHRHKISWPEKIYYALAELVQIANETTKQEEKNSIPVLPWI